MKDNSLSFVKHTIMPEVLKKFPSNLLSIIVILVVLMAGFHTLVFASFTMKWDMMNQFLPCRHFISDCVQHHILPFWCPYINFGYPFYADPQSGLFYPLTWLISLTAGYTIYTIGLEYVLHICIAAIAFFYLLKSFELDTYTAITFGIVYSLSGIFIGNAQHLPWVITLAWLPFILLYFKASFEAPSLRTALKLALFLYLAITGGYPGFFIILFYFFLVYGLFKVIGQVKWQGLKASQPVVSFLSLAILFFLLLAAGYLFSFTGSLSYIARGKPVSLIEANNVAVTPYALISLFFPFATTCNSFRLNTDISMANLYCGFLLFPLLLVALIKSHWQYFHKAIFTLAIICLMAAAGKYFYVRTWLYHFLPGMNMLRHAAIFRVFTIFGFVFISANGFNWLVNAIRTKTESIAMRIVFGAYFFMMATVMAVALFKTGFNFQVAPLFSENLLPLFNATQNVYSHISAQLLYQLPLLLGFTIVLFLQQLKAGSRVFLLSVAIIAEIFISAQLNLPATVISNVHPSKLQACLNQYSQGFPVPPLNPMASFTHYSDGSTLPIWYNLSFFKKIPAKDGFNSFYLQNVDDLDQSPLKDSFLSKPIVFLNRSSSEFDIQKFEPGNIVIHCNAVAGDTLYLQQNYYPGWSVFVDGHKMMPAHQLCLMYTAVPAGQRLVRFVYEQKSVGYFLLISILLFTGTVILFTGWTLIKKD